MSALQLVAAVLLWILALGLGVHLLTSGFSRFFDAHAMLARRRHLKISSAAFKALGIVDVVAGAGLVLGAALPEPPWIGLGAAVSCLLTTTMLVGLHRRVGDQVTELLPIVAPVIPYGMYIAALLTR